MNRTTNKLHCDLRHPPKKEMTQSKLGNAVGVYAIVRIGSYGTHWKYVTITCNMREAEKRYNREAKRARCGDTDWGLRLYRITAYGTPRQISATMLALGLHPHERIPKIGDDFLTYNDSQFRIDILKDDWWDE